MNFTVEKGQSRAYFHKGEMLEWLKRHAWKACKLQKGFRGSNPRLSATKDCKKNLFFQIYAGACAFSGEAVLARALSPMRNTKTEQQNLSEKYI